MIVEEFGNLQWESDREARPVVNISKLHSFRIFKQDLIGKVCTSSEYTVQNVYTNCHSGYATVLQMVSDIDDTESSEETENFHNQSDKAQTDQSSSDESSRGVTDDDAICPGDIVWGLHGCIWYPARVCTLAVVPDNLKTWFQNNTSTKFIACWYGDGLYSLVSKAEKLGVTQLDGKQAARSSDMQKLYNAALNDLSIW